MVLGEIVCQVLDSRCPVDLDDLLGYLINYPEVSHVHCPTTLRLIVLFAIPCAVELSTKIWVGSFCGHPISNRVNWKTFPFCALVNNPSNSDSAADAATSLRIPKVASRHLLSFYS